MIDLAHRWRIGVDVDAPLERHTAFAGGLTLGPAVAEHEGDFEVVEFVLTPAGSAAVLGLPAAEVAHHVVGLEHLLGAQASELAERLAALPGWAARFAVVLRWIAARTARAPAHLSPDVAWALRRLDATGGGVAIATLQDELGCSRRHLATRFAQTVGTTPKAYAQLVRFTAAADRLRAGQTPATVVAATGYADQAHLTRHARRFGERRRPVSVTRRSQTFKDVAPAAA